MPSEKVADAPLPSEATVELDRLESFGGNYPLMLGMGEKHLFRSALEQAIRFGMTLATRSSTRLMTVEALRGVIERHFGVTGVDPRGRQCAADIVERFAASATRAPEWREVPQEAALSASLYVQPPIVTMRSDGRYYQYTVPPLVTPSDGRSAT